MGKYKKLSRSQVAAIQMQARNGKRIGARQLGNVVFTDERNEGRSVKKAEKIAGGVIGKIARRKK
ncbi:MAG: hypothetical protein KGI08_09080 [Thaumarchaeota archaeon]|nr:hypothetical protein [Nitrososphaerota archaeon]